MKKVLFTATVDSHILAFHIPFLKYFKEEGYEVHVATNGNEKIPYCDKKHYISFERSPFKLNNLKAIKQMKKLVEKEKFDIIHTHTPMGSVVTRLGARKTRKNGTRVIYTAHGFHFYKGAPLLNWLMFYPVEKFLSRYTDTLITINKEDYERAKKKFKKCRDIQYVPGVGIDEEKFNFEMSEKEKNELRKSLGLKKDDFVMIFVARMDKNKNQGMLINCTEQLIKKYSNIKLLLVGPDERNGYYDKMVSDKKIADNVIILGYRKDISKLMKISDIALSSSLREGLPVNILEAYACGLPVVANDCRGARDLITNNKNGFVVNNESDMIKKINELIDNKNLMIKFSKNNILKIKSYYLNSIKEIMRDVYLKKKKILHVLASNKYSGAENVVCTIINNTKEDYLMYYCSLEGPIENSLKQMNINYIPIKKMSIGEIRKVIKKVNPDVIHAHDNKATVISSFFGKKYKVISHIHGNNKIMNTRNLKTILFNFCSKKLNKIIWVSDSSFEGYYFNNKVKEKSTILYNVVDQNAIIKKANEYDCAEKFDLIFLGRLGYPKNPKRLIDVIELLKQKKDDIRVAIVGDGPDREMVEEQIKIKGLNNNIKLFGFQSNPYPILNNSKILIMTSIYEGTPMCALEAQALGKPVVATPVDGLKKLIKNDYNGYLSDDNKILVKAIIKILKNDYTEKVINEFNKNNNLDRYLTKIKKIYY